MWVIGITLVAAGTRFLGGVTLLFHHSSAVILYAVSFLLVGVIMFRGFVLADVASVIRGSQIALEAGFLLISAFAVWFSYYNTIHEGLK